MTAIKHAQLAKRLFSAIRCDDPRAVAQELANGATPNWFESGPAPAQPLSRNARQALPASTLGDTAFLLALRLGSLKCAEILFTDADLSIIGALGQTSCNLAVRTKSIDWARRVCSLANPSIKNLDGRDALRVAVDHNFIEAVSYLTSLPMVDPNQSRKADNHRSQTPLCAAVILGLPSIVNILAPITINLARDALEAPSPLALCAIHNRVDCARILVENGALHEPREKGRSLWDLAASGGHIEFLKWALSNSGPLTEPDRESLLVAAAAGGSRDCVGLAFSMLSSISPTLAARALKDANPIGDFKAFLAVEIERQAISQASALGRGSTAPQLRL